MGMEAIALAGLLYSVKNAEDQKKQASDAANTMAEEQKKKEAEAKNKQAQIDADKLRDSQSARFQAAQAARGAFGRSDTILTGPLGLAGGGDTTAKKTLLGL